MAQTPFFQYKGKPLVRCGNMLYYGDMRDPFVIKTKSPAFTSPLTLLLSGFRRLCVKLLKIPEKNPDSFRSRDFFNVQCTMYNVQCAMYNGGKQQLDIRRMANGYRSETTFPYNADRNGGQRDSITEISRI